MKTIEYRIRSNDKYEEGYFFTLDELVALVAKMQTSDPMDDAHMRTRETINKYLNEYTGRTFKTDRDNPGQSDAPRL